jgi:hypothetical protein|tara:strand:- start:57588 stop:57707 length:120 start_codon:yes stop_codon:yes gene_type:complete
MTFKITKEIIPFVGVGLAYDKGALTLMLPFIMTTIKISK